MGIRKIYIHYIVNERVGKTGERASAIISAPQFKWLNVEEGVAEQLHFHVFLQWYRDFPHSMQDKRLCVWLAANLKAPRTINRLLYCSVILLLLSPPPSEVDQVLKWLKDPGVCSSSPQ